VKPGTVSVRASEGARPAAPRIVRWQWAWARRTGAAQRAMLPTRRRRGQPAAGSAACRRCRLRIAGDVTAPVDTGERRPRCSSHLVSFGVRPLPLADPSGRSSRCSHNCSLGHDSHWPVEIRQPSGGTGPPLDLSRHAAKVLSRRWRWTGETIPPPPRLTDDRCHAAPCRTVVTALVWPRWLSLMTSCTPPGPAARPRATTGTRGRTRASGATREPRARPRSGERRARRPQPGADSAPAARLTSARRCSRKARSAAFAVSSIARRYD
jgi:hypothetical protein